MAGRSRAWHEAFRIGAVDAVAERLAEGGAALHASLPREALVRWEPAVAARRAEVDRFVAERLRLGRGRALRVDARAFAAGRVAGAELVPLGSPEQRGSPEAGGVLRW